MFEVERKVKRVWLGLCIYVVIYMMGCGASSDREIVNTEVDSDAVVDEILDTYGLNIFEETIYINGLKSEYDFLFLSDNHVIIKQTETIDAWNISTDDRIAGYSTAKGVTSADAFPHWINIANTLDVDALLLGGDIIDFYSEKNIQYVEDSLNRLEVPYLYTLGNHDSYDVFKNYDGGFLDNDSRLATFFKGGDSGYQVLDYDEFYIVSIHNATARSLAKVSEETLVKFESLYNEGKPIILMVHVPFTTKETQSLIEVAIEKHDRALLMGNASGYILDETTQAFYDMVLAEESPVVAVLAGHIHVYHKDALTDTITQIVSSTSSEGSGILIHVCGE